MPKTSQTNSSRAEKCHICSSPDHVFCGFCSRCHEHADFVRSCKDCGEPAIALEVCRTKILDAPDYHLPDPESEALSTCCGASGDAYDYDPS